MLKCAECLKGCEDKTEYSGLKTEYGWLAVHRWCAETLIERIRARKPYEKLEFPTECYMTGEDLTGGWQSTVRNVGPTKLGE